LGAPFGLKGFIKLHPFSGETGHLLKLRTVTLRLSNKGDQGFEERVYEVEETGGAAAAAHIKLRGIDSPEAAGLLTGAELVVGREEAAALGKDEYYVEDLRGMRVTAPDGEALGTVTDVLEGGGGDLLEMRLPSGELRLVPFRGEFFGAVEIEKGRAVLLQRWILE
jgi:16S rRNA processing protein RimM